MCSRTVSYRSSAVSVSASLSKAIRDERYGDLQEILDEVNAEIEAKGKCSTNANANAKHHNHNSNNNPLWESNSRGWTPMHVAAIGSASMPLEWWSRILLRQLRLSPPDLSKSQSQPQSELWTRQTDRGQTVVELFFRTALDPMPWCKKSLREEAGRLKDAIDLILMEGERRCNIRNIDSNTRLEVKGHEITEIDSNIIDDYHIDHDGMLEELRQLILADDRKNDCLEDEDHLWASRSIRDEDEETQTEIETQFLGAMTSSESAANAAVPVVFRFWRKLIVLLYAPDSRTTRRLLSRSISIVEVLSGLPWCPELVGRLAIALFPLPVEGDANITRISESISTSVSEIFASVLTDNSAILPLHKCVQSFECFGSYNTQHGNGLNHGHGMLQVLCEVHPCAAAVPDPSSGRLPWHSALASGKHSWEGTLRHLFDAYPPSTAIADPVTGFPAFCLPGDSLTPITSAHTETVAKALGGSSSLGWSYLSKREQDTAREEASVFLHSQRLTAMYEVLRRDPSALVVDDDSRKARSLGRHRKRGRQRSNAQ